MGNDPFKDAAIQHGYESWYEFQYHEPKLATKIYERITTIDQTSLF